MDSPILVGAVAYDPRVVPIWEGMRDYFREAGPPIDYVLFSNYDRQVQALLARQIDIAWNTNLAWVKVRPPDRRHLPGAGHARRGRPRSPRSSWPARDGGIESLADLRGKRVALGSADSAQAAILPFHYLQQAGIEPDRDCTLLRFDLDVGKHGDTGTSELEVLRALREGRADAGALGEATWTRQVAEGTGRCPANPADSGPRPVTATAISPSWPTSPRTWAGSWTESLLGMRYDNPRWRELMDLEGLKRWTRADPAILEGYRVLFEAVERQGLARNWQS